MTVPAAECSKTSASAGSLTCGGPQATAGGLSSQWAPCPGTGHLVTLSTRHGRRCASSCSSEAPPECISLLSASDPIKRKIRQHACVAFMWFQCSGSSGVGSVIINVLCLTATPQPHPTLCKPQSLESNPHSASWNLNQRPNSEAEFLNPNPDSVTLSAQIFQSLALYTGAFLLRIQVSVFGKFQKACGTENGNCVSPEILYPCQSCTLTTPCPRDSFAEIIICFLLSYMLIYSAKFCYMLLFSTVFCYTMLPHLRLNLYRICAYVCMYVCM